MRTITVALVFILGGCTMMLWDSEDKEEIISGFYINTEDNRLFVAGQNNGYLFQIDRELSDALVLSRTVLFRPEFEDFKIDRKHRVSGTLKLILMDSEINESVSSNLTRIGFKNDQDIQRKVLTKKLSGSHYEIEGDLPLAKLKQKYVVRIAQPDSYSDVAGKIIATPATIAIDAVVIAPTVFIGILTMQVLSISQ